MQFVVLCINSKTSDICFSSLVQQTVFSNFVLTFSIKDTFHLSLTQLLMLPIFINSLSKRKRQTSPSLSCLKVVLLWASLEGRERAVWGAMHCHDRHTVSSIKWEDAALLCLLCTRVQTMERTPRSNSVESLCGTEVINDRTWLPSKYFPTWIHSS